MADMEPAAAAAAAAAAAMATAAWSMVDNKNDKSISPAIKSSLVILRQLKTSGKPPGAQRLALSQNISLQYNKIR